MSGTCTCGHRWNLHRYWQEDGFNSGECHVRKCECLIYQDKDWDDDD